MVYVVKDSRWWMLAALCLAQMTVMIDNTILNVALPTIGDSLGLGTAGLQWVVMAYSLAQAALLLSAGVVADWVGHRRMLLIGLVLFGVGSLAGAFASSGVALIAARLVMGAGGAGLMTSTLAVITTSFQDTERVRAIGLWAATGSAAFMAGPVLGGLLLQHFWWGSVFLVNVPVVLVSLAAVYVLVRPAPVLPVRVDVPGMVLWAVAMTGVLIGLTLAPTAGPVAVGAALVGVAALAGFWWAQRRAEHPMLPASVLQVPRFRVALLGAVLIAFAMGGSLFLLTLDLQVAQGISALATGVRLLPLAGAVVVVNTAGLGARAVQAWGTPATIAAGLMAIGTGMGLFTAMRPTGVLGQSAALVLMGVGIGLAMPAMSNALMSALPPEQAGIAAGINGTTQELGTSIGVAVLGAAASAVWLLSPGTHGSLAAAPPELTSRVELAISVGQLGGAAVMLSGAVVIPILLRRASQEVLV